MAQPKKILMLADPGSAHTIKWAQGLSAKDIKIKIFGLSSFDENDYNGFENIEIDSCHLSKRIFQSGIRKIIYLKYMPRLKKIISEFGPDLIHAHYATSYGLLGVLTRFHPIALSVWGDDVYKFAGRTILHRMLFTHVLKNVDTIMSTSHTMASEIKKYTNAQIDVTPFGIDVDKFKPKLKTGSERVLKIGMIKSLEKKYGVEFLIHAFKILLDKNIDKEIKLLIVGSGSQADYLIKLSKDLGISDHIEFYGHARQVDVPRLHNQLDIEVYPSISEGESFGVSVVEASACGNAVIVTNVGGLPEVVEKDVTGIIVEINDLENLSESIYKLIRDDAMREEMGRSGRRRVLKYYNFRNNLETMTAIYARLLSRGN